MRYFLAILFLSILSSCGSDSDNESSAATFKLNDLSYVVVDAGSLEHKTTEVTGQGSFAIVDPTKDKGNSYSWTGTILDGGSISLSANADASLNNGVTLKFSRAAAVLSVTLAAAGEVADVSSKFSSIDAAGELPFQIDVHNDESPAHILVWLKSAASFSEATALFNSEDDTETPGQGSGSIWGFALANATLKAASVSEPKFEDE